MKTTKKSFGQIWSELTSEQAEYLKDYINKQRQDAVEEYKTQQERLYGNNMKTPVQELIEEYQQMREDGDNDMRTVIHLARTMLEKEKKIMCDFAYNCRNVMAADGFAITHWYDKTFNTKEK